MRVRHGCSVFLLVIASVLAVGASAQTMTGVPGSASATTTVDTMLLKLDQEPFFELMSNRVEVVKGVLKTLCKRLREQNEKNMELKTKLQSL